MKARINKKPDFDREYVEAVIASGGGFSDIVTEYRTSPDCIEKRIDALFDGDAKSKMAALYANDLTKNGGTNSVEKFRKKVAKSGLEEFIPDFDDAVGAMRAQKALAVPQKIEESSDEEDAAIESFASTLEEGLEYALKQLEADEAAGEKYEEVDTSASRAALKRLDVEISSAEKSVSEAQSKLTEAEVKRTEAEERVERATEKLRRAKQDAIHANSALDSAKSRLKSDKAKLEDLKKQREAMQKEIDSVELPTFSIVPSGDCIVLKALNYDVRKMDTLEAALKWSRRIGEKFTGLTDSDFIVMGRLFGILSKLKGKFKLDIDPDCTNAVAIYDEFKTCFVR